MPISSITIFHNFKFHLTNIIRFSNIIIMQIQAILLLLVATVSAWVSTLLFKEYSQRLTLGISAMLRS